MKKQTLNGITKTFGAITVDSVGPSEYKEGVLQAQIRQVVTTEYPSKRVDNSLQDSLFATEDFNLGAGQTFESTRMAWINVPLTATAEQVSALLDTKENARVCKKYSNKLLDVLTDEQKYAIAKGLRTAKQFAETLVIRNEAGEVVKPIQYAQGFFVNDYTNHKGSKDAGINIFGDIDIRTEIKVTTQETTEADTTAGEATSKLNQEVEAMN